MNRIEIIGLFSALDKLCELEQHDAVREVVQKVLKEAESKKSINIKDNEKDD